ncbi:hypothetical protein L596_026949 [Steinernema carpocapsae]|uniref:Uncharacterized protein n=1 Tax=Steinernema carpocapsae TaxID=34508 RepID=A0A4U5M2U6_STECR|nr:hypothetical protein L596_026949 [Steinernema carpocapsae]
MGKLTKFLHVSKLDHFKNALSSIVSVNHEGSVLSSCCLAVFDFVTVIFAQLSTAKDHQPVSYSDDHKTFFDDKLEGQAIKPR